MHPRSPSPPLPHRSQNGRTQFSSVVTSSTDAHENVAKPARADGVCSSHCARGNITDDATGGMGEKSQGPLRIKGREASRVHPSSPTESGLSTIVYTRLSGDTTPLIPPWAPFLPTTLEVSPPLRTDSSPVVSMSWRPLNLSGRGSQFLQLMTSTVNGGISPSTSSLKP